MPRANGRGFFLRVYFGNGVASTFYVDIFRLSQRVVIAGLSWFVPEGSYADCDYMNLIPTVSRALRRGCPRGLEAQVARTFTKTPSW